MSAIRSRDTKPEKAVRSALHAAGYRFRTHYFGLPGRPDIVFTKRRIAVFVHGCFWHLHDGCHRWTFPRTRSKYWAAKLRGNAQRDQANLAKLRDQGWKTVVIWECQASTSWLPRLKRVLGPPKRPLREQGLAAVFPRRIICLARFRSSTCIGFQQALISQRCMFFRLRRKHSRVPPHDVRCAATKPVQARPYRPPWRCMAPRATMEHAALSEGWTAGCQNGSARLVKPDRLPSPLLESPAVQEMYIDFARAAREPCRRPLQARENGTTHNFVVERRGLGIVEIGRERLWFFDFDVDDKWRDYEVLVRAPLIGTP